MKIEGPLKTEPTFNQTEKKSQKTQLVNYARTNSMNT